MLGNLKIYLTFLLLLNSFSVLARNGIPQTIYHYEPSITVLGGVLQTRVYPGPPNYESVKRGDLAETIWLLRLVRPIRVIDDKDLTSNNETENNVREIQLVILNESRERIFERSIGKKIELSGTLFHAWSGHHHLKVLMDIKGHRIK